MRDVGAQFRRISDRLNGLEADNPADGQHYVERLCADAAKLLKRSIEQQLLWHDGKPFELPRRDRLPPGGDRWPQRFPEPPDEAKLWYDAWVDICLDLYEECPELIRKPDVGVLRWEHSVVKVDYGEPDWEELGLLPSPGGPEHEESWSQAKPVDSDWRQRAEDYSDVCDLFADMAAAAGKEEEPLGPERAPVPPQSNGTPAASPTPPVPPSSVVSVNLTTNHVAIEGAPEPFPVAPHLAVMLDCLVEDKLSGEPFTSGSTLQTLPGCKGKNIPREINERLKVAVPPLADIIGSSRNGYFLKK